MGLRNTRLTSVDRVFSRLKGKMPLDEEDDIIEWIGDALEYIGAITQYHETVCFLEVRNYTAKLPKFCHAVIQLARNKHADLHKHGSLVTPKLFDKGVMGISTDAKAEATITILIDENGLPIKPNTRSYEVPYFSVRCGYKQWQNSSLRGFFTPIRLTEDIFFNNVVCHETDEHVYDNCKDEYNIIEGDTLKLSFKEGQVALAYARQAVDATTGYPLIPDKIEYVSACVNYCLKEWFSREFYSGREGAANKLAKAEEAWIDSCGAAGNTALMLEGVDDHQNFLDQRNYIMPNKTKYFNYFSTLNQGERRPGRFR